MIQKSLHYMFKSSYISEKIDFEASVHYQHFILNPGTRLGLCWKSSYTFFYPPCFYALLLQ